MRELREMTANELHENATYYAQPPALKPIYEKDQSVIAGKLFSSYRTVFSTVSSGDSKTSDSNCFYKVLVQKEALTICQDRTFASFLCALLLSSVLTKTVHTSARKIKQKGGGGRGNWVYGISRVVEEWIFRGLIKSNIEFPEVIKKKMCEISGDLGFRP